jgi:hypothetical protein
VADFVADDLVSPSQQPPHVTCLETTTVADLAAGMRKYVCGPECPKPAGPDPDRDARIDIYRDRERRRAARALDRYMESLFVKTGVPDYGTEGHAVRTLVAGDHFVEAVGDYVLARLGDTGLNVQQKSHYGVPADAGDWCDCTGHTATRTHPRGVTGCVHHNADSVVPGE